MKTIEMEWPLADRKANALERIADALDRIAKALEPMARVRPANEWLTEQEEAAFLRSVGDDTP